jgi:hypothetical protein
VKHSARATSGNDLGACGIPAVDHARIDPDSALGAVAKIVDAVDTDPAMQAGDVGAQSVLPPKMDVSMGLLE